MMNKSNRRCQSESTYTTIWKEEEEKDNLIDCFLEVHSEALITVRLKKLMKALQAQMKKNLNDKESFGRRKSARKSVFTRGSLI